MLNDAIVPLYSEFAGLMYPTYGDVLPNQVPGVIHSGGLGLLGFTGPGELDWNAFGIQTLVMQYLNDPPNVSTEFFPLH